MAVMGVGQGNVYTGSAGRKAKAADGSSFSDNLASASKPEEEVDAGKEIRKKMEEIYEKALKGEVQPSFQIGASSFTIKEWDRFLKKFDETEEEIAEQLREALEDQRKAANGMALKGQDDASALGEEAVPEEALMKLF